MERVALPVMPDTAADAAEVAAPAAEDTAEGRSETVTPAAAQISWTAGRRAATSSLLHRWGAQEVNELWIASLPVVHWHLMSVTWHPELGMAETKQGIAHWGTLDRSWAPTKASEAAKARTVAWKRMMARVNV